ncbi:mechanosensitive ion channel family protein [Spongisporangium articulatum]|uniref:Mechanosensitive ion channel family protein n=1 Tax=Spongisporangium articulatum TaxID=3362603 RepID=A0ABW8AH40_9ACTN
MPDLSPGDSVAGTLFVTCGSGLAGAALAWLVAVATAQLGRRHRLEFLTLVDRFCRRAWICTVFLLAVLIAAQSVPVAGGWSRLAGTAVVASTAWLLVRGLHAGEAVIFARLRVDMEDNRRRRRARTQVTLLRRILAATVVLVAVCAVLMSFPGLRTFGTSLLASAGLAGVVAGLAAQTTLGNVFAGLQLAFTDAVRIDDVVVVEGEWGRVEEITLTYVVLHLWDERRLVLPTGYFTTTPFQNWTRTQSRILGAVVLHLDYATPLTELREFTRSVIEASPLWDGKDWVLQVVDTTESTMVVRVLASAYDGPSAWDLRCDLREALLGWLQEHHPHALPVHRLRTQPAQLVPGAQRRLDDVSRAGARS